MSDTSLKNMYLKNFSIWHVCKHSLEEIENMFPWEFDVYVGLLENYIEEENKKIKSGDTNAF